MEALNLQDLKHYAEVLEAQELELGTPPVEIYNRLLAVYLLQNDLISAKFLWKRIPDSVKNANPDLCHVWEVGKKLLKRDFPGIYESLAKDWPDHLKQYMDALMETTREKCFNLLATAYSCVSCHDVSVKLGLDHDSVVKAAVERGWTYNESLQVLFPCKLEPKSSGKMEDIVNDQHLIELTDFINFLEN